MTNAPHLLREVPRGLQVRRRDDARPHGLRRAVGRLHRPGDGRADRGRPTPATSAFTREEQDAFAARSHQLAARAWKDGLFDDEVVAGLDPAAQGRPDRVQGRTRASAPTRPPSRWPGCARRSPRTAPSPPARPSQISDGAAAVVVMSKAKAEELGLTWLAEIGAHGVVAGPDSTLQQQPARAIAKACEKEGIDAGRPRPRRDQRGVRRGRPRLDQGARHRPGQGQRQRRRDRARPPDRHVRRPHRPAPGARAQAPRRRRRRGRAVRRRRPGRRADRPRAEALTPPRGTHRRRPDLVERAREGDAARRRPADLAGRGRVARRCAR